MVSRIKDWLDAHKRARRYAATLKLVDKVLNDYEKEKGSSLSPDCKELIELLDLALDKQVGGI